MFIYYQYIDSTTDDRMLKTVNRQSWDCKLNFLPKTNIIIVF